MLPLFIGLGVAIVLIILILIFYPKYRNKKIKKDFLSVYGKRIYKYANQKDLYLINQLELKGNDDQILKIDHLLFGNKYIYLIKDYYLPGVIDAKENDRSFIYKSNVKNSNKIYIDNPLLTNKWLIQRLSSNIGMDKTLFIGIALINDETDLGDFKTTSKDNFLISISRLHKLLDSLEARNIAPLNDDQLKYAVKDIARLNIHKK